MSKIKTLALLALLLLTGCGRSQPKYVYLLNPDNRVVGCYRYKYMLGTFTCIKVKLEDNSTIVWSDGFRTSSVPYAQNKESLDAKP